MTYILVDIYHDCESLRLFAIKDEQDARNFQVHMAAWCLYDLGFDHGGLEEFVYFNEWMSSHGYPSLPLVVLNL